MAGQCKLLTGPAAASAQLLLAIAAFSALVYKRCGMHSIMSLHYPTDHLSPSADIVNNRSAPTRSGVWMSASKWYHQLLLTFAVR